jgi:hypothetical protein
MRLLLFLLGFIYSLPFSKMYLMCFSAEEIYNEVNEIENQDQGENKENE